MNDLNTLLKFSEALLLNTSTNHVGVKDSLVSPYSIRASFIECCGPEFVYAPLFHEKTLLEVYKNC